MPPPTVLTLPTAPNRLQSPQTFVANADAFLGAMPNWGNSVNEFGEWVSNLLGNAPERSDLVSLIAGGFTADNGFVIFAGAQAYQFDSTAGDPLPGLPGLKPWGPVWAEHFGAVGDNSTDCTAAIQAAITYVGAVAPAGSAVLNKSGVGGQIRLGAGVFQINGTLQIQNSGVRLIGSGRGTTVIRQMDETATAIEIAASNTMNSGKDAQVGSAGVEDLSIYIDNDDQTDALAGYGISVRRAEFFLKNVLVRGFRRNFDIRGCAEGSRITDCESLGQRAGTISVQATNDCHMFVGAEQTAAGMGGDLQSDGNYWDGCVGLYIDNFQSKDPNTIKMAHGLLVGMVDGLYLNNSHIGFCDVSAIRFQSQISAMSIQNIVADGNFLDLNDSTNWAIEIVEHASGSTLVNSIKFTDTLGNVGAQGFAKVDVATSNGIVFDVFQLKSRDGVTGARGFDLVDGNDITVSNGNIPSCPGGYYVYVTGSTSGGGGVARVKISNVEMRDYSASPGGDATAGIYVDRQIDGLQISNCMIYDCNGNPIDVQGTDGGSRNWFCKNILHDASHDAASAPMLPTPLWTDFINVTGAVNITGFVRNGTGFGQFNGRRITLKFAEALTITHTDGATANQNVSLVGATDYTTSAGEILEFVHHDGVWHQAA